MIDSDRRLLQLVQERASVVWDQHGISAPATKEAPEPENRSDLLCCFAWSG